MLRRSLMNYMEKYKRHPSQSERALYLLHFITSNIQRQAVENEIGWPIVSLHAGRGLFHVWLAHF